MSKKKLFIHIQVYHLLFIILYSLAGDLINPRLSYSMSPGRLYSNSDSIVDPTEQDSKPSNSIRPEDKEHLDPLVYEYLTKVNQIYIYKKTSPDELWAALSSSHSYRAGKLIAELTGLYLASSYIILPYLQECLNSSWQLYDSWVGCPPDSTPYYNDLSMADTSSILCSSATRVSASLLAAAPIVFCLFSNGERLFQFMDDCTDHCVYSIIRSVQHCKGHFNEDQMQELETRITELSQKLSLRGDELKDLSLTLRKTIFHAGAVTGHLALMKSVLRDTDTEEKRILDFLHELDDRECSICLEDFHTPKQPPERIIESGCKHYFHESCLRSWYEKRAKEFMEPDCPMCRTLESDTEGCFSLQKHWRFQQKNKS